MVLGPRRSATWPALVLFLASLLCPLVSARHAQWDADLACDLIVVGGGSSSSEIRTAPPARLPEHCAVCHWLRAMGNAHSGDPFAAGPPLDRTPAPRALALTQADRLSIDRVESRGPPAARL